MQMLLHKNNKKMHAFALKIRLHNIKCHVVSNIKTEQGRKHTIAGDWLISSCNILDGPLTYLAIFTPIALFSYRVGIQYYHIISNVQGFHKRLQIFKNKENTNYSE